MYKFFQKQFQDIKVKGFKELLKKIKIFFSIFISLPVYFFSFKILHSSQKESWLRKQYKKNILS
jgi:hypothetical protein